MGKPEFLINKNECFNTVNLSFLKRFRNRFISVPSDYRFRPEMDGKER
jgi:hypothetical protein